MWPALSAMSDAELEACLSQVDGQARNFVQAEIDARQAPTYKEMYGHCEDAPCCGCCGVAADQADSGMSKDDYMERMSDPDYDSDFDFSMNG